MEYWSVGTLGQNYDGVIGRHACAPERYSAQARRWGEIRLD